MLHETRIKQYKYNSINTRGRLQLAGTVASNSQKATCIPPLKMSIIASNLQFNLRLW